MVFCVASRSAVGFLAPSMALSLACSPLCLGTARAQQTPRRSVARSAFTLTPPPYELDALEPTMSKTTMEFHWGKHHQTYVNNIQAATEGKPENDLSVEELMVKAYNEGSTGLFNNAGQVRRAVEGVGAEAKP